jgi:hypothetical protein
MKPRFGKVRLTTWSLWAVINVESEINMYSGTEDLEMEGKCSFGTRCLAGKEARSYDTRIVNCMPFKVAREKKAPGTPFARIGCVSSAM